MQSKKQSLIESITSVFFGFTLSLAASFIIYPMLCIKTDFMQNIYATIGFTFISVARQYVVRRFFNKRQYEEI